MEKTKENLATAGTLAAGSLVTLALAASAASGAARTYFDTKVREKVGDRCGVDLKPDQWKRLQQTDDWRYFRRLLWNERRQAFDVLGKLLPEAAIYSTAAAVTGFSTGWLIAMIGDGYEPAGVLAGGAVASTAIALGYHWAMTSDQIAEHLGNTDSLSSTNDICREAKRIVLADREVGTAAAQSRSTMEFINLKSTRRPRSADNEAHLLDRQSPPWDDPAFQPAFGAAPMPAAGFIPLRALVR